METVSETEIHALRREVNRLQKEIAELQKKLSDNKYVQLQRTHSHALEERYVPNVPSNELPFTPTALAQMLSLNNHLNGITFSDIHKTTVTSDEYKLEAECKLYNLLFHLSCHLMTEPDESITVKSLQVTFQDPSLVEEIMHFINSCHREKNLQELLSGLAQYSSLCRIRETVVCWLCGDCSSELHISCSGDAVTPVIEMYDTLNRELYLTCAWRIHWQKSHMMKPYLEISVHRSGIPKERQNFLQRMCEEPPDDVEGMKEAWEELIACVEKLK